MHKIHFLILFTAILCLFWSSVGNAQTIQEMTLSEAIDLAQKNSRAWAQFDAKKESAEVQLKIVQSHWWPILSIDSTLAFWTDASKIDVLDKDGLKTKADEAISKLSPLEQTILNAVRDSLQGLTSSVLDTIPEDIQLKNDFTFTIGATLKMPLTPLFKVYQGGELAKLGIENVDIERRAKALAITYEVTEVYLKLVYAQLMTDVAQEALDTIEKHVEMALKYENVGMISHSDVLSAKVEQLKAKQNVVEAKNSTRLAGLKLAQVLSLGRGIEVKALEMPETAFTMQLDSLESYQVLASQQRTELERLSLGQKAAERKKKIALLDYVPQLALIASYQYGYGLDILKPSNQGLIGLMMSWTIFDGLGHHYESKAAELEAAELSAKDAEAKELIELEVGQKYLALSTALERVELTQQALALAEENLRTITARFEQGDSVNTDVLTAQTKYAAARADDVKARIDILIAYSGLKLSIGDNPVIEPSALK